MVSALIVAAGRGTRMGPGIDKLFLHVANRPLIAHTWQRFEDSPDIDDITLVIRPGFEDAFRELAAQFKFLKPHRFAPGGPERQDSVWNGLLALPSSTEWVAIHDGARPCTSLALIHATLEAAQLTGAAVAAQKVTDTVKESDGASYIARHLDRERLWTVQTPQAFHLPIIIRALTAVRDQGLHVTDDTAACALIGQAVALVEHPSPNPKATSPSDLSRIEWHLRSMCPQS